MRSPLVICEQCDTVHSRLKLPRGAKACCHRCGQELYRNKQSNLDTLLALAIATLIVFFIANLYPIVEMQLGGETTRTTLWGAVIAAYEAGIGFVALLSVAMVFFFPLTLIVATLYVLLPLRLNQPVVGFRQAMHLLHHMRPWSMVEVFMLGVIVAIVKMSSDADVKPDVGLWGFAILTILMAWLNSFDLHELWDLHSESQA